ncbi:MAG: hypothetical protein C4K47_01950 [Candidatus Thorarchaeota archaeon]|nr:MAG: hypothetical protein C4K47_01950 [Candidatus Thorarchaeota archaeon]
MLSRLELIVFLGVVPILVLVADKIVGRIRDNQLPAGSIVLATPIPETAHIRPGTRWTQVGTTIVFMGNMMLTLFVAIASIFDFWLVLPQVLFIHLPVWVNWLGIVFGLAMDLIGIVVRYYNVNYRAVFNDLKGKYVLATGGPYKAVRHPIYSATCGLTIAIFLITEFWPLLLTVLCWGALRKQAIYEEQTLRTIFKEEYEAYYVRTGRFFPLSLNRTRK